MAKPITDRIADLKAKKDRLAERLTRLEMAAKTAGRKLETRRKILVGGALLAQIEKEPHFAVLIRPALQKNVTRDADREVIKDLLKR
jgi:hypothetical protein